MQTHTNTDANRSNALRIALLGFALGALVLVAIALACGPAAPSEQGGGAVAATATPEATATMVINAESVDTSTPPPTETNKPAATSTPDPTATLFLINNGTPWPVDHSVKKKYSNLDSDLSRLAEEHEKVQSSDQGASGQASRRVKEVDVIITPDAAESTPTIVKFLKDNNASPLFDYMDYPNNGYGPYQLGVILPMSLLARLSQLPGVLIV